MRGLLKYFVALSPLVLAAAYSVAAIHRDFNPPGGTDFDLPGLDDLYGMGLIALLVGTVVSLVLVICLAVHDGLEVLGRSRAVGRRDARGVHLSGRGRSMAVGSLGLLYGLLACFFVQFLGGLRLFIVENGERLPSEMDLLWRTVSSAAVVGTLLVLTGGLLIVFAIRRDARHFASAVAASLMIWLGPLAAVGLTVLATLVV